MQGLVLDFAEDGVHHYQESNCYWDGNVEKGAAMEGGAGVGDKVTEEDADEHGEEDPEG